jgi:hypothetical protein
MPSCDTIYMSSNPFSETWMIGLGWTISGAENAFWEDSLRLHDGTIGRGERHIWGPGLLVLGTTTASS